MESDKANTQRMGNHLFRNIRAVVLAVALTLGISWGNSAVASAMPSASTVSVQQQIKIADIPAKACHVVAHAASGPHEPKELCEGARQATPPPGLISELRKQQSKQRQSGNRTDHAADTVTIGPTGSVDYPVPSQGNSLFSIPSLGIGNPDRFTTCSASQWDIYTWTTDNDGDTEITGEAYVTDYQWILYSPSLTGSWIHELAMYNSNGWGDLSEGTELSISNLCDTNQSTCLAAELEPAGSNDGTPTFFANDTTENDFVWQGFDAGPASTVGTTAASSIDSLDGFLGVWFQSPTYGFGVIENGSYDGQSGAMPGRCDNVLTTTDACVNEDNISTLTYDSTKNPLVAPVAQHIYNAQQPGALSTQWGVPGGSLLTRDTSASGIAANRTAACGSVTVPTGDSCDEFPMASTYQGASFSGPGNFSTAIVPKSANDSQGGLTGGFYSANRVIDGDPFYVLAILPNGTPSW